MPTPTWAVYIDTDDDGDFETGENIASYVLSFESRLGFWDEERHAALPCTCTLIVNNQGGEFDGGGVLGVEAGRYVRILATHTLTYSVWTGCIAFVEPHEVRYQARVVCIGRWAAAWSRIECPIVQDATADAIWRDYLSKRVMFRPRLTAGSNQAWLLEVAGRGELDDVFLSNDRYDMNVLSAMQTGTEGGETTFAYFGDQYEELTPLIDIVNDLMTAENGYFYEDTVGKFFVIDRNHVVLLAGAEPTPLTGAELHEIVFRYSEGIVNRVVGEVIPRRVEEDYLFWTLENNLLIRQGGTLKVAVKFIAADGFTVAALGDLVEGNFVFHRHGSVEVTDGVNYYLEVTGRGAKITVVNGSPYHIVLLAGATLTGTALIKQEPISIEMVNEESRGLYGERTRRLPLKLFEEPDQALDLADLIMNRESRPAGRLRRVKLRNTTSAVLTEQLSHGMMTAVAFDLAGLGHADLYAIYGIAQRWDGRNLETEWFLRGIGDLAAWTLNRVGFSELDETTVLAY